MTSSRAHTCCIFCQPVNYYYMYYINNPENTCHIKKITWHHSPFRKFPIFIPPKLSTQKASSWRFDEGTILLWLWMRSLCMHHKNTLELYIIHIFTNLLLFGMKCILICLSYITFTQVHFICCLQSLQLNKILYTGLFCPFSLQTILSHL